MASGFLQGGVHTLEKRGYLTSTEDYFNHTRKFPDKLDEPCDDFLEIPNERKRGGTYYLDLRDNGTPVWSETGHYSAQMFTDKAISVVNSHDQTKPLFLYLAYQSVHSPLEVPERYMRKYKHVKDENRRIYAGMVTALDEGVGNLTAVLKAQGMWENTILIFSTDNGGQVYKGGNNYPLRGWKGSLWEGGIHGIGFVTGGAFTLRGAVNRELIHVSDWFPTLIHLAGGNLNGTKPLDGIDQWQTISTGSPGKRKVLLHNINILHGRSGKPLYNDTFDTSIRAALRVGDFKLITGGPGNDSWVMPPGEGEHVLRFMPESHHPDMKKVKNVWLFNITADPTEHFDLADSLPEVVRVMLDTLKAFNNTAVPPIYPKKDPNSNPALHGGVWGPWM